MGGRIGMSLWGSDQKGIRKMKKDLEDGKWGRPSRMGGVITGPGKGAWRERRTTEEA